MGKNILQEIINKFVYWFSVFIKIYIMSCSHKVICQQIQQNTIYTRIGIGSKIIYKTILAAIVHVIVKEILQHFVVVYKVGRSTLEYMDPGDGRMHKVSHEDFKKM